MSETLEPLLSESNLPSENSDQEGLQPEESKPDLQPIQFYIDEIEKRKFKENSDMFPEIQTEKIRIVSYDLSRFHRPHEEVLLAFNLAIKHKTGLDRSKASFFGVKPELGGEPLKEKVVRTNNLSDLWKHGEIYVADVKLADEAIQKLNSYLPVRGVPSVTWPEFTELADKSVAKYIESIKPIRDPTVLPAFWHREYIRDIDGNYFFGVWRNYAEVLFFPKDEQGQEESPSPKIEKVTEFHGLEVAHSQIPFLKQVAQQLLWDELQAANPNKDPYRLFYKLPIQERSTRLLQKEEEAAEMVTLVSIQRKILNFVGEGPLTVLPELPSSIQSLLLMGIELKKLPKLPDHLETLILTRNQLQQLPKLPPTLRELEVSGNKLTVLPPLPDNLLKIDVSFNKLKSIPLLPKNLQRLSIAGNPLTEDAIKQIQSHPNYSSILWSLPGSRR